MSSPQQRPYSSAERSMRRIVAGLAVLASAILISGCGSDGGTSPSQASFAGTWNLTSVDGAPLPFTVQATNPKMEVLSDRLVAGAAGTFTETTNVRFTDAGLVSTEVFTDAGTWTLDGTAVTIRFSSDGSTFAGTIAGNTFTSAAGGYLQVFSRQ